MNTDENTSDVYDKLVVIRTTIACTVISLLSWFFFGWSVGSKDNVIAIILVAAAALMSTFALIVLLKNVHEYIKNNCS